MSAVNKKNLKLYLDTLERVVWTGLEGAGAVGIVAFLRNYIDLADKWWVVVTILIGVVLAGIKGAIATSVGNGTASTLPVTVEPVPALAVQGELPAKVDRPLQDPRDLDGDGRDDSNGRFV